MLESAAGEVIPTDRTFYISVLVAWGLALKRANRFEEALDIYQKALETNPPWAKHHIDGIQKNIMLCKDAARTGHSELPSGKELRKQYRDGRSEGSTGYGQCGRRPCGNLGILKCSACKVIWYCGKECQRLHWKEHKTNCKSLQGAVAKSKKLPKAAATRGGSDLAMGNLERDNNDSGRAVHEVPSTEPLGAAAEVEADAGAET